MKCQCKPHVQFCQRCMTELVSVDKTCYECGNEFKGMILRACLDASRRGRCPKCTAAEEVKRAQSVSNTTAAAEPIKPVDTQTTLDDELLRG